MDRIIGWAGQLIFCVSGTEKGYYICLCATLFFLFPFVKSSLLVPKLLLLNINYKATEI